MSILATDRLSKSFSGKYAVNDITLELECGKIYGLLGPNGSGKSTLMKLIAGLYCPSDGDIRFQGELLSAQSKGFITFMPTEPYFYRNMTIKNIKNFHGDFFDDFEEETFEELIEFMELSMNSKISILSSGMVSKLKIAIAMSRNSKLVMLDEPLNGIDLVAREKILSAIIKRADEKNTLLISSHLIHELENILDEIFFIKDGSVVLSGRAETIREEHNQSIVQLYKEVFSHA